MNSCAVNYKIRRVSCTMKVLYVFICMFVFVCAVTSTGPKHGKNVVCYFSSWAVYRPGFGKYTIEDIQPALCTHLVYAFAGLEETNNTIKSINPWEDLIADYGKGGYKRMVALKRSYPHLKVTLAVGGWDEGSLKFSNMAANKESRATFIRSVLAMINEHNFDGIDLHWKYPTMRDGKPYDKENFVLLVKELSEALKPDGYLLSAAIGSNWGILESAYDLDKLSPHLDFVHLMSYDYHGTWNGVIGANAPLRGMTESDQFSVEFSVNYLISHGVPSSKIIMGLPMYGRTFVLTNPSTKELEFGSTPVQTTGFMGPYTREPGFIAFNEICLALRNKTTQWEYNWHVQSSTPYLRDGERVITYDNGRSIAAKAKMAIDKGLGGVMAWTIDMDDFRGDCNETDSYHDFVERYQILSQNPLTNKVARSLNLLDVSVAPIDGPSYVLKDNQLHLRLPKAKFSSYTLMQTINDAMALSVEEKRIENEIADLSAEVDDDDVLEDRNGSSSKKYIVCYFTTWAAYRPGLGSYNIEDIQPALCTHLVYAFAGFDEKTNTIKSLDPWQDFEENFGKAGYKRVLALKQRNPNLKVILAVGGWNEGSKKFSNMASKAETRTVFINSVLSMLNKHHFDGLDVNWEYPTKRDGKPYDKGNFVLLVKELSEAMKPQGYILTAALGNQRDIIDSAYDLPTLSQYLDLMLFMCYDYHGTWERVVNANAPLKGKDGDILNVESTIDYVLSKGVPPQKVVLGLPLYGRTFLLEIPSVQAIEFGSTPTKELGFRAPYTKVDGFISYNEVCEEVSNKSSQWEYHWHEQSATPYLRDGERVISYDNGRSLANKVKLAVNKGLGGVMVWSIDMDDFRGNCTESDAYVDFVERHQRMLSDPLLKKALKNLGLLHVNQVPSNGPSYLLKDGQLHLRLPQAKFSNYALMQTINDALTLSVEEKRIEDEMAKFIKVNEIDITIEGDGTSIIRVFIVAASTKNNERRRPTVNISLSFD